MLIKVHVARRPLLVHEDDSFSEGSVVRECKEVLSSRVPDIARAIDLLYVDQYAWGCSEVHRTIAEQSKIGRNPCNVQLEAALLPASSSERKASDRLHRTSDEVTRWVDEEQPTI